jgi:hypothetical protein
MLGKGAYLVIYKTRVRPGRTLGLLPRQHPLEHEPARLAVRHSFTIYILLLRLLLHYYRYVREGRVPGYKTRVRPCRTLGLLPRQHPLEHEPARLAIRHSFTTYILLIRLLLHYYRHVREGRVPGCIQNESPAWQDTRPSPPPTSS